MFGKKTLADLKAVLFLRAIDQYEGKRSAAKMMDVSIDTLTKYIEDLEQECGTELLNVTASGCKLTSRGIRFAEYAAEIGRVLQHMYALMAEKDDITGEIRLLFDHNIRANLLTVDLWNFMKKHRHVNVVSRFVDSLKDIKNFSYDLAISYHLPSEGDWELLYSGTVKSKFFASTAYLKKFGYPENLEEMLDKHYMIFKYDSQDWMNNGKFLMDRARNKAYISDTSFMISDAVASGVGIGILPASFVRYGLVALDNIECDTSTTIYVIAHRHSKDLRRVQILAEHIKEILNRA